MVPAMIGRFCAAVLFCLFAFVFPANAQTASVRAQAVVELYTSQGCTQCPRANRLLGMFAREEEDVLALTFPVGIWDYLGWQDTLAQPEFSERQRDYSRTMRVRGRFTPQLVMNGSSQISGSYWDEARATLEQARRTSPINGPDVSITRIRGNRVRVAVGASARPANAEVWLVAYDPGPVAVFITRGVNLNRRVYHYNLVRWIERVGTWNGDGIWYERPRCTPECAVIVQEPDGGRVLSAAFTRHRR